MGFYIRVQYRKKKIIPWHFFGKFSPWNDDRQLLLPEAIAVKLIETADGAISPLKAVAASQGQFQLGVSDSLPSPIPYTYPNNMITVNIEIKL